MFSVIILEPDPVISLDLCDAVQHRDKNARVEAITSVSDVSDALRRLGRPTHAFLRFCGGKIGKDTVVNIALALCRAETRVVVTGVHRVPSPIAATAPVAVLPFPFAAGDVSALLTSAPGPGFPSAA